MVGWRTSSIRRQHELPKVVVVSTSCTSLVKWQLILSHLFQNQPPYFLPVPFSSPIFWSSTENTHMLCMLNAKLQKTITMGHLLWLKSKQLTWKVCELFLLQCELYNVRFNLLRVFIILIWIRHDLPWDSTLRSGYKTIVKLIQWLLSSYEGRCYACGVSCFSQS